MGLHPALLVVMDKQPLAYYQRAGGGHEVDDDCHIAAPEGTEVGGKYVPCWQTLQSMVLPKVTICTSQFASLSGDLKGAALIMYGPPLQCEGGDKQRQPPSSPPCAELVHS